MPTACSAPSPRAADTSSSHGVLRSSWVDGATRCHCSRRSPTCAVPSWRAPRSPRASFAEGLFHYGLLPIAAGAEAWDELWSEISRPVETFLDALENQSQARSLAAATMRQLHRLVALHLDAGRGPVQFAGATVGVIDAAAPLAETRGPQERLVAGVQYEGEPLGVLELPIFEGVLPQLVLRDALAASHSLQILGVALRRPVYDRLTVAGAERGWEVSRDGTVIARGSGPQPTGVEELQARFGWCVFLQELWGRPTWPEVRFYDPLAEPAASETIRSSGPHLPVELSEALPDLELSGRPQSIQLHLGGVAFGELWIEAGSTRVTASDLRARVTRAAGAELARVAVREALIGRPLPERAGELRTRLADAARVRLEERALHGGSRRAFEQQLAAAFGSRTVIVPHRAPTEIDGPASRWAALPAIRSRLGAGNAATPVVYAPGVLPVDVVRGASTPVQPAPGSERNGGPVETHRLPILLYHRVADGPDDRWTLTPDQFRRQVDHLVENGYYTVGLEQWRNAMERHAPLPGRAVLLSFDDAYADFASGAWPILRAAGLHASLFVVAGEAGGTNRWDHRRAGAVAVLGWDDLVELSSQGVEIGSHSLSHPDLRTLAPSEIYRQLHDARLEIEQQIGGPVRAVAYPYGLHDGVVRHLAGAAGYHHGLTIRRSAAGLWEDPLALPRIEVRRHDTLEDFDRSLRSAFDDGAASGAG
jgi:peptidoglycan/xylan/chitin deacetylase (PgdA/CDA1 family)